MFFFSVAPHQALLFESEQYKMATYYSNEIFGDAEREIIFLRKL